MSSEGALAVPDTNPQRASLMNLLRHYEEHGLVAANRKTGEEIWSLTRDGSDRLVVGQPLHNRRRLLQPTATDPKDMSLFELFCLLEQRGWACQVVEKEGRTEARRSPYRSGGSLGGEMCDVCCFLVY